tara:strand:+ start:7033 stop:8118 length:1086 start_codon:yes stop_codon:yes gene_type:complete
LYPLAINAWAEEEVEAACAQIRSGYTTMGQKTKDFEEAFAAFHGCKYAVMVNSGSSANLLMVAALVYSKRLPRGSRVAVPALSWNTTYAPLEMFGMEMEFVGIDNSLTIDPYEISGVVHNVTLPDAIFAVNLLGNPCDYSSFPSEPILIEDNCESLGATYGNKMCGTVGVMGSHSLFFSHHIHTMEGGVVTTDDEELYRLLLMLRAHGWTRDLPENKGSKDWTFAVPGFNVRPTDVQAAAGIEQLKKLPAFLDARRKNGEVYMDLFSDQGYKVNGDSSWFAFPFFANPPNTDEFETRPIVAGNIGKHEVMEFYKQYALLPDGVDRTGTLSGEWLDAAHNGFMIGNHPHDCSDALNRMRALI